jgi:hypothetical protein
MYSEHECRRAPPDSGSQAFTNTTLCGILCIVISQYNLPPNISDLSAYKAETRRLQVNAGIDPKDCIELVESSDVNERGFVTDIQLLEGLVERRFLTARDRSLEGRKHDEFAHFGNIVATHPEIVGVYALFAEAGLSQLSVAPRLDVADIIDGALGSSLYSLFNGLHRNPPKVNETVEWGSFSFSPEERERLLSIEAAHRAKIWNVDSLTDF